MAETSEFMTDLPQSSYLSLSIKRAISAAQQRSHRYVTLEHLLLALLDDPSAIEILEGVRADIPGIRVAITETVNRNLATLYTPGEFDLRASYKVERVLQTASDDAERLGCGDLDAAFVLAALSRETDNPAAGILKRNAFTYTGAVTWLYSNRGMSFSSRASRARDQAAAEAEAGAAPAAPPEPAPQAASAASAADEPADAKATAPAAEPIVLDEADELGEAEAVDEEPIELDIEVDDDRTAVAQPRPAPERRDTEPAARTMQPAPRPPQIPPGPQAMPQRPPRPFSARPAEYERPHANGFEERKGPGGGSGAHPVPLRAPRRPDPDFGFRDNAATARALPRRTEPQVPPASRLEEMRVGAAPAKARSQLPVPAAAPPPPASAKKKRGRKRDEPVAEAPRGTAADRARAARARRPLRPHEVVLGRLIENIPRRMRAAVAERIEVRISREETQMLSRGMEGQAQPVRHDITITQTMSVALRAPDGGFTIEPLSPETQWIFERPDEAETYGRWRWVVTADHPGQRRLQLIIAARSIGHNGIVGDTALPDQVITVSVRTNYWRSLGRGLQWIAAMLVGGVLTELAMVGLRMFSQ